MSNPKRQHFIPKSYLKNFAVADGDKFFVEAKQKSEPRPKDKLLSTRDICVDKNLYTLPFTIGDGDKYYLEKFYAKEIDGIYPDVYKLLTNPDITFITPKQRAQIVMTTMSLFFRTPKFLNFNERRLDVILDYAAKNHQDKNGRVKLKFRDYDFDFDINEIEETKEKFRIQNKIKFLHGHLSDWHKFTEFKINAGLSVFRIYEEIDLITSDNPVIMHSVKASKLLDIFDPDNIISLPIDNKHFLTIFPNSESAMTDRIFRGDRDKWFALTTNSQVEQNSEDWILGKPNSIHNHIRDQINYNRQTADNYQAVEDMKEKAMDWQELNKIIEESGGLSESVAERVKILRQKRIHKNDPEVRKIIVNLVRLGYLKN